jgi:hypothetical protein
VNKDEMGEAHSRVREMPNGFSFSRDHLEDLGAVRGIILKWIFKNKLGGYGLISFGSG